MNAAVLCCTMLLAGSVSAYDAYDPKNCNGFDWDEQRPVVISKVTARPRANFVKSPYDDDFKAEACPAPGPACQKKSYLVTGDLVFTGKEQAGFTCISFQSPLAIRQIWATGWLPSSALAPVAPMPAPKISDWIGNWYHPGGSIEIKAGDGGTLDIEAGMTVPTARDFHNGDFKAHVTPKTETLAFADESGYGDGCQVRMQRIDRWLMVEDNGGCGGAAVTFAGLYRRKK